MVSNKIIPAYILRLYTWAVLEEHAGMEKIDNLIPIIPLEDEPALSGKGKPYVIYGYAESSTAKLEQIRTGVLSLRILAPKFAQLSTISNTLALAFESIDIATEAVNRFSSQTPSLNGIRFTSINVSYTEGAEPAETEGGMVNAVVNIAYSYINDSQTPLPAGISGGTWI